MPSLKSLRLRIRSITSTQKIIKAMQMISASRLRHVRHYFEHIYDYKNSLNLLWQRMLKDSQMNLIDQLWSKSFAALKYIVETDQYLPQDFAKSISSQKDSKSLLIFITTDRGLCGSYNSQLMRRASRYLEENNSQTSVICIGKKGYDNLKKYKNITLLSDPLPCLKSKSLEYGAAYNLIIEPIMSELVKYNFTSCDIIYTQYVSTLVQRPACFRLMPFDSMLAENNNIKNEMRTDISVQSQNMELTYEPKIETILPVLLYQYIETVLYEVVIESLLSEHASRMVAMDGAYRNSKKILDTLKSQYNRGRQANITRELIEIISGNDAIQVA